MGFFRKRRAQSDVVEWEGIGTKVPKSSEPAPSVQYSPGPAADAGDMGFLGTLAAAAATDASGSNSETSNSSPGQDQVYTNADSEQLERLSRRINHFSQRIELLERKIERIERRVDLKY